LRSTVGSRASSAATRRAAASDRPSDLRFRLGRTVADLLALVLDLRDEDLALALRRQVLTRGHREDARERRRDARDQDSEAVAARRADGADDRERADQTILHPEERLADLAEQLRFLALVRKVLGQPRAVQMSRVIGGGLCHPR